MLFPFLGREWNICAHTDTTRHVKRNEKWYFVAGCVIFINVNDRFPI